MTPVALRPVVLTTLLAAGCGFDPGNTPLQVDGHTLEPTSVVFGRARYESDGVLFVDNRYDVTWVLVTERADACAEMTANAVCEPGAGGESVPMGPSRPLGAWLELTFNSFAEDARGKIGERGDGDLEARLVRMEQEGATFAAQAVEGDMDPYKDADREQRVFSRYDLSFEDGSRAQGSFSATRCAAMDEILRRELYELPPCP